MSQRPRIELGRKVRELTNSNEWSEQAIGDQGVDIFDVVLGTECMAHRHDNILWNLMEIGTNGA